MTPAYRTACVYVRNTFAGELRETDEGYSFTYDAEYLALPGASAVSLTLPLREETYKSGIIFPFFDGLIPEGWLLDVVSRNWKLDRNDRFGLLLVACRDSIGNVGIREARE
jgi:serine/threonine-protein kinase HipA